MSMPKLEIKTDANGCVTYSVTEEGVLLTKEHAERIASRIAQLEALVKDMGDLLVLVGAPTAAYGLWSDTRKQMTELGIDGKEVDWYEEP